jgi:hypothetical protein
MRIQSPLSNLSDVLTHIKESATRYQATLKKNEAATRAVLIDPVLRALGWDTANTYMVEVEKTLDQARVDYALYDKNATVHIIIDAKSLGVNLAQPSFILSLVKRLHSHYRISCSPMASSGSISLTSSQAT